MLKNMLKLSCATLLLASAMGTITAPLNPAKADPIEPGYNADKDFGATLWYAPADKAAKQADIDFIIGMRPHHAGALTMSADYLGDKNASHGTLMQLARGIAHNQEFEIKMLDIIENFRTTDNEKLPVFMGMRPAALHDLGQKLRFTRAPMPLTTDAGKVSERDVQFAKAMIIHHQGALDMALDYLNNPHAKNGYLRHMCLDILMDQKQEIDFMQRVINNYDGNPDDVKIDESMIHGMEGMSHGGHHDSHGHHGNHHGSHNSHKSGHDSKKQKSVTHKAEKLQAVNPHMIDSNDEHHNHH